MKKILSLALPIFLSGCVQDFPSQIPTKIEDPRTNLEDLRVDLTNYELEEFPYRAFTFFAKDSEIYFAEDNGKIFKIDESNLSEKEFLGKPAEFAPRLLFVSSQDTIFASPNLDKLYVSREKEKWEESLNAPIWRMTEDDLENLYVGVYAKDPFHRATLFSSSDEGKNWRVVFNDFMNDHIHTVRFDDEERKIYLAFGDSSSRGQAVSEDYGATWNYFRGKDQGHTDVAFTKDYVLWGSDDKSGRIFRVDKKSGLEETVVGGGRQFIWFLVSDKEETIYAGTMTSQKQGGEKAALIVSSDQGENWQKIFELPPSQTDYQGFADSRELSSEGYLYFNYYGEAYRVRRSR